MTQENNSGLRCHDVDACAMGQKPCPTPKVCGCAAAPRAITKAADRAGTVYLSGPMTGYADFNFPAFNAAASDLRAKGFKVINPADHGVVEGAEWVDYLRTDLAHLTECERIHLLPGWSKSKGAQLELQVAQKLSLKITLSEGAEPFLSEAAPQAVQAAVPNDAAIEAIARELCAYDSEDADKVLEVAQGKPTHFAWMRRTGLAARILAVAQAAPAHPAEGVPAQASEWDGKLPERLQSALNALRFDCPPVVADVVEFEVRSHYEAMHTSLSTSRRMYSAARDRLEAIDAAQPDPFAATQPAAQPVATITGLDEFGPLLGWHEHWAKFPVGTNFYTQPAAQGMDAQDAARWREVLQHVGAAPHFGGQHFTLNTLQAPDTSLGFKANLMSGSVAQHFTKAIDATLAAQAKQGGA